MRAANIFSTHRTCQVLAAMILTLTASVTAYAEDLYTQASTSNLRARPSADGELVARLPIGTYVTVEQRDGEWVQVTVPMPNPHTGWLHQDFVAAGKPSLRSTLSRFDETDPQDLRERLRWIERAAATAPAHAPTLSKLAEIYEALGRQSDSMAVRRSIAGLEAQANPRTRPHCLRGQYSRCATIYYAPDSFHDLKNEWGVEDSEISCRRNLTQLFYDLYNVLIEEPQIALHSMGFTIPIRDDFKCEELNNNRHWLVTTGENSAGWIRGSYPTELRVQITTHTAACGGGFVVEIDSALGEDFDHLLLAAVAQSVPSTDRSLPYFPVEFGQPDGSGRQHGALPQNDLVSAIWLETASMEWTDEPGATPQTVQAQMSLSITTAGNGTVTQRAFIENGIGKYSYSDADIHSVIVADINDDQLVDIVIDAINAGRVMLVSKGLAPSGQIIWESHRLKQPNYYGVGGC